MERIELHTYKVAVNEQVTIAIKAYQAPNLASIILDGGLPQSTDTFTFKVSKPLYDTHRVDLALQFPPESSDTARYEIEISGSFGGSFALTVAKTNPTSFLSILFYVGDTGPK